MNVETNLWILYVYRFFASLVPAYVIERLYWEERGMTIQMVIYTEMIYAVTIVLLEIPTGILADRWGRKHMLVLSALLGCGEFLILLYATSFWHFALVVFLAGVSRSAASGAENALLYDTLMSQGREASFEKQLGRLNAVDWGSAMLAALAGSLLAGRFGLELNYWISWGSSLLVLLLSLLLTEPKRTTGEASEEEVQQPGFRQMIIASLLFFRQRPEVCVVVLSGMATGTAIGFIDEFWQLYVSGIGIPVMYFGIVSAALMLLRLPGNLLAHRLLRRYSIRAILIGTVAIFCLGFGYAAVSRDISGLIAILAVCLCSGILEPTVSGYLHHRAGSAMRATVESFKSLGLYAVHMVTGLGFGYMASRSGVFGGYAFVAAFCGIFLVWLVLASGRLRSDGPPELRDL